MLLTAFKEPPRIEPIESWDKVPGDAGAHPADTRLDPVASAEAFKQLVELGYVAPPGPNAHDTVAECVRELKYNLARSYRDGNFCGEAVALAEELWTRWPQEHRFGLLLIDCLAPLRQVARRRAAIEELVRRIERYQVEAKAELERRAGQKAGEKETEAAPPANEKRRARFEERRLQELTLGRPLLLEWLFVTQALLENRRAEARRLLGKLATVDFSGHGLRQQVAGALMELGELEIAQNLLEQALESDLENPSVHGQLAGVHFEAGRFDRSIASATESLSLLYFQPGIHALLGRSLMETNQFAAAEQELQVAIAQSPRNLSAHEALGKLYRQHLKRPEEAFAQEGRAQSLRNELAARQRRGDSTIPDATAFQILNDSFESEEPRFEGEKLPDKFGSKVQSHQIITVVSGLPRSGTSLMMQLLVAAGREALTDARRVADEDNPLGYFEFDKTLNLAKDASWIPEARGKVVKIVAQLLPYLPRTEYYHVILMNRNLEEVIASQRAMLTRQGHRGAELDGRKLSETYRSQLQRVRKQVARRPEIRILPVNYGELVSDPAASANRLAHFLGDPFDQAAAVAAVHPELRRQKH